MNIRLPFWTLCFVYSNDLTFYCLFFMCYNPYFPALKFHCQFQVYNELQRKQRLNLLTRNLSFLFLVSVWKCPIIVSMLGLALGICIPSNTLHNTLSPPCLQIKWFKICKKMWNVIYPTHPSSIHAIANNKIKQRW